MAARKKAKKAVRRRSTERKRRSVRRKVARKKTVVRIKSKARKVVDAREGQVGRAQGEAFGTQGRALGPPQGEGREARGEVGDPQHGEESLRSATRTVEKAANQLISATAAKVEQATVAVDQSLAEPRPITAAPPAQAA